MTRHWLAHLQLQFESGARHTKLQRAKHFGPLRVQRPFYPEGDVCHLYILHPPGGMAPGDKLSLEATLGRDSTVLLTTPSAGKVYCSDTWQHPQQQGIIANLGDKSCLEWLPQETIVFSGAEVALNNHFELQGDAQLIAWDIVCLGRRASGEQFQRGNCMQRIDVNRDGKPLLRERCHWQGGSTLLDAHWGMGANVVSGTLFATVETARQQLDDWREALTRLRLDGEWGVSQKPGIFVARYLGMSAADCRSGFETLWSFLRPLVNSKPACRPRIWNT